MNTTAYEILDSAFNPRESQEESESGEMRLLRKRVESELVKALALAPNVWLERRFCTFPTSPPRSTDTQPHTHTRISPFATSSSFPTIISQIHFKLGSENVNVHPHRNQIGPSIYHPLKAPIRAPLPWSSPSLDEGSVPSPAAAPRALSSHLQLLW